MDICEYCKNEFIKKSLNHKYCSDDCQTKHYSINNWKKKQDNIPIEKRTNIIINCKYCNNEFTKKSWNQFLCSNSCKYKYNYYKDHEKSKEKNREWHHNNLDQTREYSKNKYNSDPLFKEKILNKNKKWREENREKYLESKKKEYLRHRERYLERSKQYQLENKDEIKEQRKIYRLKNVDNKKLIDKEYQQTHKEERNIYLKEYRKKVGYKLNHYIRNDIRRAFSNRNPTSKKELHSNEIIGYTADELKQHIEKQFKKDMNWDNYGTLWNLDHLTPITFFPEAKDYNDPIIKKIWSLENLTPVYCKENFSKGNRYAIVNGEKISKEEFRKRYLNLE
jgi:hypothetical protein